MGRSALVRVCLLAVAASAQRDVRRAAWDAGDPSFAQRVAAHAEPLVLSGAPSAGWNVSWDALARAAKPLKVKEGAARGARPPAFGMGCCEVGAMEARDFVALVHGGTGAGRFGYLSMPALDVGGPLEAAIPSVGPLLVEDLATLREVSPAARRGEDEARVRVMVWAGSAGVVTPPHLDMMHNFFTQFAGAKTFELLPPTSWRDLGMYPKAHVLHRNARAAMGAPSPHHAAPPPEPFRVTLRAGETLYVPPLWFHRAVAGDPAGGRAPALSLNVWSPSAEVLALKGAWEAEPFVPGRDWTGADVVAAASYYLRRALAHAAGANPRAAAFLAAVLATRFGPRGSASARLTPEPVAAAACAEGECAAPTEGPVASPPGLFGGNASLHALATSLGVRAEALAAASWTDPPLAGTLSPHSPELAQTAAHLRRADDEAARLIPSAHVDGVMAEVCAAAAAGGFPAALEAARSARAAATARGARATAVAEVQGELLPRGVRRTLRRSAAAALRAYTLSKEERAAADAMHAWVAAGDRARRARESPAEAAPPSVVGAAANASAAAVQLLGVREIMLAHWVEDVAGAVVGADRAAEFLARCVLAGFL